LHIYIYIEFSRSKGNIAKSLKTNEANDFLVFGFVFRMAQDSGPGVPHIECYLEGRFSLTGCRSRDEFHGRRCSDKLNMIV